MNKKWWIRTNEIKELPLRTVQYTDYYTNSLWECLKLRISKNKKITFIQKRYN